MSDPKTNADEAAALDKVRYQPLAPIGNPGSLKALLERNQGAIAALLPKHVTPERLIKTLLVAANRNPDLLKCTQASLIEGIQRAAELGLDLSGTLGEAYLVPFNNKVKADGKEIWLMQATFIPGYKGLAKLAWQSGEVSQIDAEPVHEFDTFIYEKGTEPKCVFKPKLNGERGKAIGYYALVRLKNGGVMTDWMTVADVERVRQRAVSKNSPAWRDHFDEMGRKTVFRRLAKWLPMSSDKFRAAVEQDNLDFDMDTLLPTIEVDTAATGSKAENLAARLAAGAEEGPTIDVQPSPQAETVVASPGQQGAESKRTAEPAEPAETGWAYLAADQAARVRALATESGVRPQDLEEIYGCPLEEIHEAGLDSAALERKLNEEIRRLAGRKVV